ncbi:hypothetical protein DHEL01_v209964 [Diaporthe helianthi]|uniref:Uncharacterized protein n=1 Tax=Diaporthe helianthi TaxID=158607 RepID=A0A2P5HN12_DIAHE|nr:hypothetical protein DHEL01_v209964 [Diaporthe helianthi]
MPDTSVSSDELKHCRAAKSGRAKSGRTNSGRILTPPRLSSSSQSSDADADDDDDAAAAAASHEAIEQAYEAIWRSFCDLPVHENPRPTFYLKSQHSYERLYERLDEQEGLLQYFENSIRKSWDSNTGRLILDFMAPSPLHGILVGLIDDAIRVELDRISDTFPTLRPFRRKIITGGESRIRKPSRRRAPEFETCPDQQWLYSGARHPAFVLEVAYSQDGDDLDNKVTGFFKQLPGRVCNVLGIDVTYLQRGVRSRGSHSASVSLWTSHDEEDGGLRVRLALDKQVFRTDDGQAQPGDLILPFSLFVPSDIRTQLPDLGPEAHVCISFACLSDLVSDAEQQQRVCEATASPSPEPQRQRYKRVAFERADGTVAMVEQMLSKRRRVEPGGQASGEDLGRTRSQSRLDGQTRRSERVRWS